MEKNFRTCFPLYAMEDKKDSDITTRQLLEELLEDDHCLIHLNTKAAGLSLPESAKSDITVTLKLSHHFAGAVILRDAYVEAELRFGSFPFQCAIPYKAIWAVTSVLGHHTIWEERAANPALPLLLNAPHTQSTEQKTPKKTAVSPDSTTPQDEPKKERPSFLRRVK